jgi:hypothetical protein
MKKQTALICLCLLLGPAPWGIALNYETEECGGYCAGDEYGGFELPVGWEAYYPDGDGMIQTEIGSCSFGTPRSSKGAESCCQELGYAYVGLNIGKARTSPLLLFSLAVYVCKTLGLLCAIGLAVSLVIWGGSFLWERRRKKQ